MYRLFWLLILAPAIAASAEPLERGELTLEACHLDAPGRPMREEAFCAEIEVPEDHAAPEGRKIPLRVAVLPAIRRDHDPDPLVLLAGGPGQASTEAFLPTLPILHKIHRHRDLVLIDQRGTGRLSPLTCEEQEELGVEQLVDDEIVEQALQDCLDQIVDDADPKQYTTLAAVRDLDLIFERLGYSSINLYGVSYGSRLAQLYTRHHEGKVRTLILDGVVPLDRVLGETIGADAQRVLDVLFDRCEQDSRCAEALPSLRFRFDAFIEEIDREPKKVSFSHPRTGEPIELHLTRPIVGQILRLFVYSPESAALVPLLIDHATRGDVARLAVQWMIVSSDLSSINPGLSLSVTCGEDAAFFDSEALAVAATTGVLLDDVPRQLQKTCAIWPHHKVPAEEKTPLETAVPTLLLSGEYDPVTPPSFGDQVLPTLQNARHIVVPGMGHNVVPRGCVARLMEEFVASADLDALDPSCVDGIKPLPIFLSFTGPVQASKGKKERLEAEAEDTP